MRAPLGDFAPSARFAAWSAAGAVVGAVGFQLIDGGTRNELTPLGQISFQFAGSVDTVEAIVDRWSTDGVIHLAGAGLGFDYLFMALYGWLFLVLAARLAGRGVEAWSRAAVVAGWAVVLAVALDVVEGILLLAALGDPSGSSPALVAVLAGSKFALLALSVVISVTGLVATRSTG